MPRPCSICNHYSRDDIEAAIVGGDRVRAVAARYDVGKNAVNRHAIGHMSYRRREAEAQERANAGMGKPGKIPRLRRVICAPTGWPYDDREREAL
jgi:hypothetical protein